MSKIALRLFSSPTSSASSERVWSVYSFIHSKKRNRLGNKKIEMLAYIYINAALLDSKDFTDYTEELEDENCINILDLIHELENEIIEVDDNNIITLD